VSWNFIEAPAALATIRDATNDLKSRASFPQRYDVPKYLQDVSGLDAFTSAYARLKDGGKANAPTDFLYNLSFEKTSQLKRFYQGQRTPWNCLFWIDDPSEICVALACFYNQQKTVLTVSFFESFFKPTPSEPLFQRSVLISSAFGFLEQSLIYWLQKEKNISVK
jgi:hypothetical protein